MKLPNAERAVVEIEKLRGYCLSRTHPRGRHKARVLETSMGLTAAHAELPQNALLAAARTSEAAIGERMDLGSVM